MHAIEAFFNLLGSLICHQLPERTLRAGVLLLPVCARDMGIYTGIFVSGLFLLLFRRLRAQKPPRISLVITMCLLMLPMMFDGVLSYCGIIETSNAVRLFTGLFFGLPIPFFLVPAAHFSISGKNESQVLDHALELVPVYSSGIILCILLLQGIVPYWLAGSIFASGLLFLLSRISYTIFARMQGYKRGKLYMLTTAGTVCILIFLFLLSAFVLQPLKEMLL
jgi:uncharacterized membrane protein